jgi:hypothetical protein
MTTLGIDPDECTILDRGRLRGLEGEPVTGLHVPLRSPMLPRPSPLARRDRLGRLGSCFNHVGQFVVSRGQAGGSIIGRRDSGPVLALFLPSSSGPACSSLGAPRCARLIHFGRGHLRDSLR